MHDFLLKNVLMDVGCAAKRAVRSRPKNEMEQRSLVPVRAVADSGGRRDMRKGEKGC